MKVLHYYEAKFNNEKNLSMSGTRLKKNIFIFIAHLENFFSIYSGTSLHIFEIPQFNIDISQISQT